MNNQTPEPVIVETRAFRIWCGIACVLVVPLLVLTYEIGLR